MIRQDADGTGVSRSIFFTNDRLAKVDEVARQTGGSRSWVIGLLIDNAQLDELLANNSSQQVTTGPVTSK
jgi:hypothetical protein